MSSSVNVSFDNGSCNKLLSYLIGLDQSQLEEFKLCLQSPELLLGNFQKIPWANLKASNPINLLGLLGEYFSERQIWEVILSIFENMNLTSLCVEVRATLNVSSLSEQYLALWRASIIGHFQPGYLNIPPSLFVSEMAQAWVPQDPNQEEAEMPEEEEKELTIPKAEIHSDHCCVLFCLTSVLVHRRYRAKMKAKILMMWDNMPWPEGHIYLRNVTEKEHEELKSLLYPNRTGAQPQTIVLEGVAGVGKTTLAMKAMLHWTEGLLFQQRFSYVFFISCHKLKEMKDTTFAALLSWDWPDSQPPIEELMSHPERLLFVIDGFEEMDLPSNLDNSPPCTGWYQRLPVNRILLYLLRKELVPMATLLITTKEYRTKDLKKLLLNPWFIQILGFTEGDREEYFIRYFGDQNKAKKILRWVRKNENLFYFCSAPMVCWIVCSCLKRQMARNPCFQLSTQTTTSLYVYFFSSLFAKAEVSLSDQSWSEQWRALCSLAAEGMWFWNFTFAKEDLEHKCLEAPFIDSLLRLNILRKVSDCEECVTFTHQSFQVFLGAIFYALGGTKGSVGSPAKHEEMKVLLNDALADTNLYWNQMALFFFGLLKRNLAGELEAALRCKVSHRIMDELLEWAEELGSYDIFSNRFEFLHFFECLYETQEEDFVRQILSPLLEADLDIFGNLQLQVSSFCLKHCQKLSKLRLSITVPIPQMELTFNVETLELPSKIHQWQDICSMFCNGNVSELDLSNSKLNTSSMKKLCYELRNPRCKLRKLICKSITPVRILKELVLVLHGNNRLTHLNLSSNNLGVPVSTMIFKTLRHSACNLQYLCLEKCNLSGAIYQDLALYLTSTQRTTRLCLGFNPLQDDGVRLLCASLTHPECALERLVLWFCQLSVPSCRYLSDALLENKSLTHLNLRRNNLRDEGVKFLCKALSHPDSSLQNLDLSGCSLTAEGCQELANALKHNHNMKNLDLGNNDVRDDGVKHLCEVLKDPNCALNTLGLEKCNLTPACCQHLSLVLGRSKSLVNLNLLQNDLEPSGVSILWKALKKSTCKLQKLGEKTDNQGRQKLYPGRRDSTQKS
ncbi:NACHT, LRR and PYD domains-containing protein 13 [Mirounga angustirostris]|uniref:NACHT, LRR and PYD domains-containing protein 13 n=1 Tax=Mirounga angustirostris TaxID=9716 RepID=UPI00313E347F